MMKHDQESDKKQIHMRLPLTIGLAILIFLVIMGMLFGFNSIQTTDYYGLRDNMRVDVYYTDGSTQQFEDGDFGTINKGDVLQASVILPDDLNMDSAELYIPLYNAIVDVYLDGQLIFKDSYDSDDVAGHYGNRVYEIPLPYDYASKELVLNITSVVSMPYSDLKGIGIIPANEAWKKIIEGEGLVFVLSIALMVMAMIFIVYFTIQTIHRKKMQLGLPIAVFELLISAWFFGSLRMFYLIFGNIEFCSKVEYYALYLAPIPLTIFIYLVLDSPIGKKIIAGEFFVYLAFYLVATGIELSPVSINYSHMLSYMHLLAGIVIVGLVVGVFVGTKKNTNRNIYILRYGVMISMVCGILELIRFNVTKYVLQQSWVSTHGVSALAILVIAMSLVIYLISFSADEYTLKIERQQLMMLAYKDALTDMPNRASCYRRIEEMEEQGIREYTMVFIDLNNLKTANDVYGHETGDRLLKMTAGFIQDVFSEEGFCARWGGDEFVACVFGGEKNAAMKVMEFQKKMEETDQKGEFPFKVSAACGTMRSNDKKYLEPLEAIRQADAIMYENKKQMKAAGGA
ncbi:MAG: diguanylate cyclase [Lachnospiraceae bacterium]|nr:diguanylate cyclase [Lachnospiraceae bacterium]